MQCSACTQLRAGPHRNRSAERAARGTAPSNPWSDRLATGATRKSASLWTISSTQPRTPAAGRRDAWPACDNHSCAHRFASKAGFSEAQKAAFYSIMKRTLEAGVLGAATEVRGHRSSLPPPPCAPADSSLPRPLCRAEQSDTTREGAIRRFEGLVLAHAPGGKVSPPLFAVADAEAVIEHAYTGCGPRRRYAPASTAPPCLTAALPPAAPGSSAILSSTGPSSTSSARSLLAPWSWWWSSPCLHRRWPRHSWKRDAATLRPRAAPVQ